mgnify:CR=1 FL=1
MIEETKQTPFLTTVDNVWNPFTNYDEWLAFDLSNGYCSNQTLAKLALVSPELSEEENRQEIERAVDRVVEIDPTKTYTKVYRSTFDTDMAKAKARYDQWMETVTKNQKTN